MLNIQATKQQLIAMSNRMMTGNIKGFGKMQGHCWLKLDYEGRDIEILFNKVFGVYRISAITDFSLKQSFFEVSE